MVSFFKVNLIGLLFLLYFDSSNKIFEVANEFVPIIIQLYTNLSFHMGNQVENMQRL